MAYEQAASRLRPILILFLLDDSASMSGCLAGTSDPKYAWVERYVGLILHELLKRSTEMKGDQPFIKPRYFIHVIKYGSTTELWGTPEMDIETAVKNFSNGGNSLGLGGHLSGTDTEGACQQTHQDLQQALTGDRFRDSFPPMVLHLTDGESQTDALRKVQQIMQLSTNDGNVLMVNAYIGAQTSLGYTGPEDFPGYLDVSEAGPGQDNVRLFEMSSQAPPCIEANLKADGIFPKLRSGSRLFFDVRTKEMLKNVIQVVGSMGVSVAR
jgi:hypothetical protein